MSTSRLVFLLLLCVCALMGGRAALSALISNHHHQLQLIILCIYSHQLLISFVRSLFVVPGVLSPVSLNRVQLWFLFSVVWILFVVGFTTTFTTALCT